MKKRFVIHKHNRGGQIHWDLMFEQGESLMVWRLDRPPEKLGKEPAKAEPSFPHDRKFLTYQGIVNSGAGTVEIVDEGFCEISAGEAAGLRINFDGKIVKGCFFLEGGRLLPQEK